MINKFNLGFITISNLNYVIIFASGIKVLANIKSVIYSCVCCHNNYYPFADLFASIRTFLYTYVHNVLII